MSYRSLLQLLILFLACLFRQGYYELLRHRITDRQRFGYGDGVAILGSLLLAFWTAIELYWMATTGKITPSVMLTQVSRWGVVISILLPSVFLGLTWLFRLWPGNFFAGLGRGLISFGVAITLLACFCWLP